VIDSYTFARLGSAHHSFGADTLHPTLTTQVPYDQSATGLGDVALRVKYSFPRGVGIDAAALLDVRFPTGKKEDFLGSGKTAVRIWGIISKQVGDITPHLNIGYRHKPVDLQSDAVEFRAGFDNKLFSGLTFCFDLLGQVDLNSSKAIHLAPGTATLYDFVPNGLNIRTVSLSNIPDRTEDNTVSGAAGFRYAPSDNIILLANILFPLNDGGLRAQVAPTVGVSINL
jgi:hypothetical protein